MRKKVALPDGHALAAARPPRFETGSIETDAQRLVGLGFRYWILGWQYEDIHCWEEAWRIYSGRLGPDAAGAALGRLSSWVSAVCRFAHRPIAVYPGGCVGFCRDECIAISMIAASQHDACPALKACAFALMGCSEIDQAVAEAQAFGETMSALECRLPAESIVSATAYLLPPSPRAN